MTRLSYVVVSISFLSNILLCQTGYVSQEPYSVGYRCCDTTIKSLTELPADILTIVKKIFDYRLGFFAKHLVFVDGQVIDLDSYFRLNKNNGQFSWQLPAYDLRFSFSDTSLGIQKIIIQLTLDKYGQVISFQLPHRSANPEPINIIPMKRALFVAQAKARADGFLVDQYKVDFGYDERQDALVWKFDFVQEESESIKNYRRVIVSAKGAYVIESTNIVSITT